MRMIEIKSRDGTTAHLNPEAVAMVYPCQHYPDGCHIMLVNGVDMDVATSQEEIVRLLVGVFN